MLDTSSLSRTPVRKVQPRSRVGIIYGVCANKETCNQVRLEY